MKLTLKQTMGGGAAASPYEAADGLEEVGRYGGGFGGSRQREGLAARLVRVVPAWLALHTRGRSTPAKQLNVVETLSLGGRRQMVLVLCQGERFLVGCGADTVQTIVHVPVAAKGGSCP